MSLLFGILGGIMKGLILGCLVFLFAVVGNGGQVREVRIENVLDVSEVLV
jgi:hypothetical protein|tara:strand:- start:10 stop:159 length:150 start_codon:yes stop_codon:yes gene_type:complete